MNRTNDGVVTADADTGNAVAASVSACGLIKETSTSVINRRAASDVQRLLLCESNTDVVRTQN